MEFVQFHPTALYENTVSSGSGRAFLISEAVRGFGGKLLNLSGERFMARYDQRLELAPRDIVARAIDNELKRRGDDYVLLDISHKSSQALQDSFPNIYAKCKSIGIDLTVDPIPVVPAAHYACGGVTVDEYGRTTLNNLFAAGEVTMTGVHGANRLASNSLLEALVFASRAAEGISRSLKMTDAAMPDIPDWDDTNTLTSDEKVLISHSAKELKQLMWDYVGIVRSDLRLKYAERRAENLYREVESFYKTTKVFPSLIELRNLITCSRMIIESSLMRKENRGLHFSLDYVNAPQIDLPSNSIIQNPYLNT
jgi:L-aspartate oxidase